METTYTASKRLTKLEDTMAKLRIAMLSAGGFAAFIAACFSDGEVLLGVNNSGIVAALLVSAAVLAAPAVVHFYNTGRI